VVVVDNVPLGPAVVGSVMSNMGYRSTRLFEQGFGTPSMTGNGFADSLQTLTAVRKNLLSRVNLGAANVPNAGSDMETSFANYVRECTLTGVDLNQKSVDAILRDADPLNAIRFDSDIYMTQIYVGGQPQTKTCTDAWTDLSVVANGNFATALEGLLQPTLGVPAAGDTVPKIQDAFAGHGGGFHRSDFQLLQLILSLRDLFDPQGRNLVVPFFEDLSVVGLKSLLLDLPIEELLLDPFGSFFMLEHLFFLPFLKGNFL
jgi:conjugal transfer mating pair stabilization protein TraG